MIRLLRWGIYTVAFVIVLLICAYAAGQYYKPVILEKINAELKDRVEGDVQIGKLDFTIFEHFPNVSITLGDIYLRGPHYDTYQKNFLTAEKIYVHIDFVSLFKGAINLESISIKNGNIFIFRDSKGYTNMDAFKKQKADTLKKSGHTPVIELEKIHFESTRLAYVDTLKHKSYDITFVDTDTFVSATDSSKLVSLTGEMFFGGITFNTEKGGYLSQTKTNASLNVEIVPDKQRLILHSSELQLSKFNVGLEGQFDFLAPGQFQLSIVSKGLDYNGGLELITRALQEKLKKYQFDGPIDLTVKLVGKLTAGDEPSIDIAYTSPKNNFTIGSFTISDLSFTGTFNNHLDSKKPFNDNNSAFLIDTLSGTFEAIRVNAKLTIADLINPNLTLDSKSTFNLTDFNHETDTTTLKLLGGKLFANVQYKGKLNEYFDGPKTSYKGKLNAVIKIKDGELNMKRQEKLLKNINGQLRFTEKQMNFDKIDFIVNDNPVTLKGSVVGFIPFFLMPEKKGRIDLSLYSPHLDLASLNSSSKKEVNPVKDETKKKGKRISDLLDVLNNKVEFVVNVKADELKNGAFLAKNFSGKISMGNDQFVASPVTMSLADGQVDFSLKLSHLDKPVNPVVLQAEVRDADINKFFASFDNFSQKTIQAKNLSGKVFTKINLTAKIDDRFNVMMPTLDGEVDFKLREGQLKDFEPLQNMSNFLLKRRDFNDVQFAEIKGTFHIQGQYLDVSRMEIESTVLSLFLEGRYSLGDSTDLSIQVPLSNLKRRDKSYKPENVGVDAKVGPSVFLRAHQNKQGKMVIVYTPFKKFKKNKG